MKHIQSRRQHHLAIVQVGGRVAALLLTSVTFLAAAVFLEVFWYVCMTGLNMIVHVTVFVHDWCLC